MKMKIFISLTLISLSVSEPSLRTRLRKCCQPDQIFSDKTGPIQKVDCVPTSPHAMELYKVDRGPRNVNSNASESQFGLPICENPEHVTTMFVADLKSTDFLQESSCLDILHNPNSAESDPIIVQCRSNEDRDEQNEPVSASLPRFLNVRRCCPKNTLFDHRNGSCVSVFDIVRDGYFSDTNEFLSLLPKELDTFDFLNVSRFLRKCSGATFTYVIDPEDLVLANGILQVTLTSPGGRVERLSITSENSCLELTPDFRLAVRVCRTSDLCQDNACVSKCCPEVVPGGTTRCFNNYMSHFPSVFHEAASKHLEKDSVTEYGLLFGLRCEHRMYMMTENDTWIMTSEGHIRLSPELEPLPRDQACLETFRDSTGMDNLYVYVCFPEQIKEPGSVKLIVLNALQAITCVFLLLTLLVYACLPALQNLHGKTLMCHVASLLVAFATLVTIPWATPPIESQDTADQQKATAFCSALGFIMLFSFLSAFCWLNVMCFDIWRTFGRLRGTISRGQSHGKQFLLYCLYAWGLSLFITIFAILSDKMEFLPYNMRPNFGPVICWFEVQPGMFGDLIFFRGPIAIQLTSNVVFFILTSERCSKVKAEIRRVADPSDPRSKRFHADKTKFIMNVKLFVVMGISWIAEIISAFVNEYTTYSWREIIFYPTDVLNCLQGVLIFFLFVMKKRVYQAMMKRLGFDKKKGSIQGTSTIQDPLKVKKSASNSTLTSSFGVSLAP